MQKKRCLSPFPFSLPDIKKKAPVPFLFLDILRGMALRDHAIWWPGLLAWPVLLGQALHVRRTTPLLASAPSPHSGTCKAERPAAARQLSIYLVGESTVAGVGARSHERGLSGQLASRLAERLSRPVRWEALGLIGARARDCLEYQIELELIPQLTKAPADLIVIVLGVNDTTKLTARATWRAALRQIVLRIRKKTSCPILFTSVAPMEHFRALPQPLRLILGARARMLDDDLARMTDRDASVYHHRATIEFQQAYLAADGFHPSELGYALWTAQLAERAAALVTSAEKKGTGTFFRKS